MKQNTPKAGYMGVGFYRFVMRFYTLLLLALFNLVYSAPYAVAICVTPQQSQGGAELFVISPTIRVRFERTLDGEDVGLKLQYLGQNFKRLIRRADATEAVLLIGKVAVSSSAGTASHREVVRVLLAEGLLVISTSEQLLVRSAQGSISCQRPNPEALERFVHELGVSGIRLRTTNVYGVSEEGFAQAIGL
jgi:hypothetical protein